MVSGAGFGRRPAQFTAGVQRHARRSISQGIGDGSALRICTVQVLNKGSVGAGGKEGGGVEDRAVVKRVDRNLVVPATRAVGDPANPTTRTPISAVRTVS